MSELPAILILRNLVDALPKCEATVPGGECGKPAMIVVPAVHKGEGDSYYCEACAAAQPEIGPTDYEEIPVQWAEPLRAALSELQLHGLRLSPAVPEIVEPGEQVHCDTFEEQCKLVESER